MSARDVDLPELRLALMRAADERVARRSVAADGGGRTAMPVAGRGAVPLRPVRHGGALGTLRDRGLAVACSVVLVACAAAAGLSGPSGPSTGPDRPADQARRAAPGDVAVPDLARILRCSLAAAGAVPDEHQAFVTDRDGPRAC